MLKRSLLIFSLLASLLVLTGCSAGSNTEPRNLSEAITQVSDSIKAVNEQEDETKRFQEITSIQVSPSINPKGNHLGLSIRIFSNSSNIESTDWDLLFKTIVKDLGTGTIQYIYDVAIPLSTPTPNPTETETPAPTPVVSEIPANQEISFISLTGIRNGGSGEEIKICETSGFQKTKLECKDKDPNSPYLQEIEWSWIKDTYR